MSPAVVAVVGAVVLKAVQIRAVVVSDGRERPAFIKLRAIR